MTTMTESTIVKQEMFDEDVMKSLLIDPRFSKKYLAKLSNYNKHRITGSTVNVLYKFGKGCEERKLGRLFPDGGIGLQSYRSDIRSPLSQKWYWDTDVENAHYVIALEFCRKNNLKHDKIKQYVDNRDDCLALVSSSRKKAKTEFLKVLYGGDITLYIDFFQEVEGGITSAGFEFLHEIEAEVSNLMTVVWDKNPDLHKLKTGKENKMICKKPNPKASLMSLLFQTEERLILLLWDKFLQDNNRCLKSFCMMTTRINI